MLPARSHISAMVEAYLGRHPEERDALTGLQALLTGPDDPCDRSTLPGHITCSAVVIDRDRHVLHIGHKASGKRLTPGGHPEPADRTLLATALREVGEEAGIRPADLCLTPQFLGAPADIDVHHIDARPDKGEEAHRHYDFRFAFYLASDQCPQLSLQDEEVSGAEWLPFTGVRSPTLRAKLLNAERDGLDGQPEPVNASALIHDGQGRYLLHLRDMRDGIWEPGVFALLGGGREVGDSCLEATLRRELAEEVPGLHIADLTPYAVEKATSIDGLAVPIRVYTGSWSGDPDTVDLREGVLLRWFAPDVLDLVRLSDGLGDLIRQHAAEHPPPSTPPAPHGRDGTPSDAEPHIVGVHLFLQDDDGRILLGLRHPDSAYAALQWHALAGHCARESAIACLVREAREEANLVIDPANVEFVHMVHLAGPATARPRLQLFFQAHSWSGTPEVREPDRCLEWRWWDPKTLPAELVPYTRTAIVGILARQPYSQMGWT